ncbi:MAG: glycosyltransferase, partial [Bacteroidia bacterium]
KEYETPPEHCVKGKYAPNGEKIIVHISNFRKVKRIEDVIQVFDRIRKELPAKLILVGDGPEKAAIEQLCRQLNLGNDVINLGKIADPKEILSVADLFILPSETESFGLSALEAMAMKVPVISTNSGGLPEVNIQGKTGYLSDVGNVEEMSANAIKLLSDKKLFEQFRQNAFAQAKKFDIANILPQYEKLYQQLLTNQAVLA